ncbi:MAG: hypothetical protein LBD23_08855 [Oscillospiraceae bacterium]|jgi:hypothetical protein|nr:hypothetical protein [Oscillospiraceae bacterium]
MNIINTVKQSIRGHAVYLYSFVYQRSVAIYIALIAFLLIAPMSAAASTGNTAPADAPRAISMALEADAELSGLVIREQNAFARLIRLRDDPEEAPDAEMAEIISDIHWIWARFISRSREVTAEVLRTIMAVDNEMSRQEELEEILEELAVWIEAAETDFRTARIDSTVLSQLTGWRDRIQNDLSASSLQLRTHRIRFRELTGHTPPGRFDFGSAWLLTDIDDISFSELTPAVPMMIFNRLGGVIPALLGGESAGSLESNAHLKLMALHEAVGNYARADEARDNHETQFLKGEINKYELYGASFERFMTRLKVYDHKYDYAMAMLELDSVSGGLISSTYRKPKISWFYDSDWTYDGRLGAVYTWMEDPVGAWRIINKNGSDEELAFMVQEPPTAERITHLRLYYDGKLLAENNANEALIFRAPDFGNTSLAEVVFYNGRAEVCRVYIDGFTNTGRFFEIPDEEIEETDETEETEEIEDTEEE